MEQFAFKLPPLSMFDHFWSTQSSLHGLSVSAIWRSLTSISTDISLSNNTLLLFVTALSGFICHLTLFIHGEWHRQAPDLFTTFIVTAACLLGFQVARGYAFVEGIGFVLSVATVFSSAMLFSIIVYRRYFHRLSHFEGPYLASVSKFWHVWKCLDSKNHLLLDELREKYGDFVRTGPSEVACFAPEVVMAIDGPGSPCDKAVWYDLLLPEIAVNTTRDRAAHDRRRRIWDHGFTNKALAEYQERIVDYAHRLEHRIGQAADTSTPVDASVMFYWFTFDVMGEFAFGKSFNMLEDERWHFAVVLLRKAMRLLGPLTPVPWLAQIAIMKLPWFWVVSDWLKMLDWCRDRMRERMKRGSARRDVAHHLISASEKSGTVQQDLPWIYGDAVTIVIAGSDTAAPTLVYIFYELCMDHTRTQRLRDEIDQVDIYDHKALESCDYLNGVINETLRLHPPVPSHGYRQTPPEGLMVGDTHIPGNVTVIAPRYSLGRLPSCFVEPESFIPERWSTRPELVKNKKVFQPFGQGRYGCVGKQLALRELRFVVALLVKHFDVAFAPGEDGETVVRERRDYFTAVPGSLKLSFTRLDEKISTT